MPGEEPGKKVVPGPKGRRGCLRMWILLLSVLLLLAAWLAVVIYRYSGGGAGEPYVQPKGGEEPRAAAALCEELERHVTVLAVDIGERNVWRPESLARAEKYIAEQIQEAGYELQRDSYEVQGQNCSNLIAELPGSDLKAEIVVVGGHYDTVSASPGANDNGSGVAATLALARLWIERRPRRSLRFLAFVNEESPFFQTEQMGSMHYARTCKGRGEKIVAMLSLETMGYFSQAEGSQQFPLGPLRHLYPTTGNFIAFVGTSASSALVRRCCEVFRQEARIASEMAVLPSLVPGAAWSDHWSFGQMGYLACMVTDTAPFRYPHYHSPFDLPEQMDFPRLALVVEGLDLLLQDLVSRQTCGAGIFFDCGPSLPALLPLVRWRRQVLRRPSGHVRPAHPTWWTKRRRAEDGRRKTEDWGLPPGNGTSSRRQFYYNRALSLESQDAVDRKFPRAASPAGRPAGRPSCPEALR